VTAVDDWNAQFPPGTPVRYWPGAIFGDGETGETCSKAWATGSGDAIVACTGRAGGIALTHVEPLGQDPANPATWARNPRQWSADVLAEVVRRSLHDADMQGVDAAMRLLVLKDPHRAQELLDTMRLGLALAGRGDG